MGPAQAALAAAAGCGGVVALDWREGLKRLPRPALGPSGSELRVEQAMSTEMATAGTSEALRSVARLMADRELAAAVVESEEPGILTARDVLERVATGGDPDAEQVGDHFTAGARKTSPGAPLDEAARTMVDAGFRHLVVSDGGRTVGLLAMRDIVRCWVEARQTPRAVTPIREAMNTDFLTLRVDTTVERAARAMSERGAAAAVVEPSDGRPYPGIFTEREVLHSLTRGGDPASERLADHLATEMTFSAPGWSLKQAAEAMTKGGFQHIVVVDRFEVRGVISMRDVVRRWTEKAD
jgi:CBS domain-containing protein